jgi:hypothetical protein
MIDRCVPNISRISSIYESDPAPSNKMSTNTNQIRPIFRAGTKDESDSSAVVTEATKDRVPHSAIARQTGLTWAPHG